MILYHGSNVSVPLPDVSLSRSNLDFGRGFYLTSYREQARDWAIRKAALSGGVPVLNSYDFDCSFSRFKVLSFEGVDDQWVRFVCECRKGGEAYLSYDLICGGVADDKVYYAVDMFMRGLWDMETTLAALRYYKVNDQWCFVTQRAVDELLRYLGGEVVER